MAALTPHDLLDWLVKHQFLTDAETKPYHSPSVPFPDAKALAKLLIDDQRVHPFVINQVLQGKGHELLLGSYRLLEKIGEGAMGQVYKARDIKRDRIVAIKMIHKEHL